MLSSRYLHLHEALELGPMWLRRGAAVATECTPLADPTTPADTTQAAPAVRPTISPAPHPAARTPDHPRAALLHSLKLNRSDAAEHTAKLPADRPSPVLDDSPFPALRAETLSAALADCRRCALHTQRRQPLAGRGNMPARLLVISPHPAPQDDIDGRLLGGEAGILLDNILAAIGLQPAEVYISSQVKCTPHIPPQADDQARQACTPLLRQQLDWIQPQAVLFLGQPFARLDAAARAQLSGGRPHCVIAHPARLLRQPELKAEAWRQLQTLLPHLNNITPAA